MILMVLSIIIAIYVLIGILLSLIASPLLVNAAYEKRDHPKYCVNLRYGVE